MEGKKMRFKELYFKVRPIVQKTRREYYLKGWEASDWEQEGMLVLHQLLEQHKGIHEEPHQLYRYYKVKFRNYIKDQIRKQESQKRRFDRMNYEEIGEISHEVKSGGLLTDELICLRDGLRSYYHQLPPAGQKQYQKLLQGERFKGRQELLVSLRRYLEEYER